MYHVDIKGANIFRHFYTNDTREQANIDAQLLKLKKKICKSIRIWNSLSRATDILKNRHILVHFYIT